jgi:hypothetical protein
MGTRPRGEGKALHSKIDNHLILNKDSPQRHFASMLI